MNMDGSGNYCIGEEFQTQEDKYHIYSPSCADPSFEFMLLYKDN